MKRTYKGLLLLACAALLLFAAGCGASQEPTPAEEPEPTPHVHLWDGGVCAVCGEHCEHEWRVGVCTICGARCEHQWEDGVCAVCGLRCPHVWQDGVCTICGLACEHVWADGACLKCGMPCPHPQHDPESLVCPDCGTVCPHDYCNGVCTRCGAKPVFVTRMLQFPIQYKNGTDEKGAIDHYHYVLGKGELLPEAHGTVSLEDRRMRDVVVYTPYGYDENERYNVLIVAPGAGHSAHRWMEWTNLVSTIAGRLMGRDILDRLIASGEIDPLIIVVAEYYLNGSPEEVAVRYEQDLRERVLPFIAQNYGTYASVDENGDFVPAPEHYAYMGCSFGAMIGWQMLPQTTDLFAYWGLLSGAFQNDEEVIKRINDKLTGEKPILCLYAGEGKRAQGWMAYRNRIEKLSENCEALEQGYNLFFVATEKTEHAYPAWDLGLYNCLQVFYHSRYDLELPLDGEAS